MQIIYVDESQASGSINYFIIALLVVKDVQSLRIIKYVITDLQRGKRKEIKGTGLKQKNRKKFIEKIKEANYGIYGLVLENCFQDTDGNFKLNAIRLLLKVDSQAILPQLISEYYGKTCVVFDHHTIFYKFITDYNEGKFNHIQKPEKRAEYELMDWYIDIHENRQGNASRMKESKIVERKKGHLIDGIMAVDIFANGIKRKYVDGCDDIFNLFSNKIKGMRHITYQGGTFSVETVYSS